MNIDCVFSPYEHCEHPDVAQLQAERDVLIKYAGLLDRNINTFGLPLSVTREIGGTRRALSEQTRKEMEDG